MPEAPSPEYIPASTTGGNQPVNVIVLHSAVMDLYCGAARDLSGYAQGDVGVSWHYTTDSCELFQNVYDNTVAYHDGMNHGHIGIEMCEHPSQDLSRWDSSPHANMFSITATLVRQLCQAYDVPMVKLSRADVEAGKRGICGHNDIPRRYTTHWDPGAFPWDRFLSMVRDDGPEPTPEVKDDDMGMQPIPAPIGKGWHVVGVPAKNGGSSGVVKDAYVNFSPHWERASNIKLAIYDERGNWMSPEWGDPVDANNVGWTEVGDVQVWKLPSGAGSAHLEWTGDHDDTFPVIYLETRPK